MLWTRKTHSVDKCHVLACLIEQDMRGSLGWLAYNFSASLECFSNGVPNFTRFVPSTTHLANALCFFESVNSNVSDVSHPENGAVGCPVPAEACGQVCRVSPSYSSASASVRLRGMLGCASANSHP